MQPRLAQFTVAPRADRPHIEGVRLQCVNERQVVKLGVVRHGHHGGARVGLQAQDQVVRHLATDHHTIELPAGAAFLARVAHDHLEAQAQRHLAQETREVARADHDEPGLRPEVGGEVLLVELRQTIATTFAQVHLAGLQVQNAFGAATRQAGLEQFVQPAAHRDGLQHQLHRAATRQAEAVRFVGRDAVAQHGGRVGGAGRPYTAFADAVDQVVFDAAARDRAHRLAAAVDGHERARWPGRRAPGARHRDQHHRQASCVPAHRGSQHARVEVFQAGLRRA